MTIERIFIIACFVMMLSGTARAGNSALYTDSLRTLFSSEQLTPSNQVSSSAFNVERCSDVVVEINVTPALTGGATLVVSPRYVTSKPGATVAGVTNPTSGNKAGYPLPLQPTDNQTFSSGDNFIARFTVRGEDSMLLSFTASTTETLTATAKPR